MPNKAVILKAFTREVILNSVPGLKERIQRRIGERKIEKVEMAGFQASMLHKGEAPAMMPPEFIRPGLQAMAPQELRPPAAPFTLRPAGIDFGKMLPLIQNPSVTIIECPGAYKELIIRTYNIRKNYPIMLSTEEMMDLINQFAKKARVPVINGLFRVWIDKFLISAMIMNNQAQSFIIQKVIYPHFT